MPLKREIKMKKTLKKVGKKVPKISKSHNKNKNTEESVEDKNVTLDVCSINKELKKGRKRKFSEASCASDLPEDEKKRRVEDTVTAFIVFATKLEETQVSEFLKDHNISYTGMRFIQKRRRCFVDLEKNQLGNLIKLNGSEISGVKITIKEAETKSDSQDSLPSERVRLVVKNLSSNLSFEEVKKRFPMAIAIKLPKDPSDKKKLRGYGFLDFENESIAEEVLKKMQNVVVGSRPIKISKAKTIKMKQARDVTDVEVPSCLLVKQLSYSVTKEMLKKYFLKSKSARIVMDPKTKKSKGFGFVEFYNDEDAEVAMEQMQRKEVEGRRMVISIARKKKFPGHQDKKEKKNVSLKYNDDKTTQKSE